MENLELVVFNDMFIDADVSIFIEALLNNEENIIINKALILAEKYDLHDNIIQGLLTCLLAKNENVFSLSLERNVEISPSIKNLVIIDIQKIYELFNYDLDLLQDVYKEVIKAFPHSKPIINKEIFELLSQLQIDLSNAKNSEEFYTILINHYKQYGVGAFGLNKAFRYHNEMITPIEHIDNNTLEDLIGYHSQKEKLISNTEAFLEGCKANNVLLYGDSGTGKSSSIKALLNKYYKDGLRMVEVYKHQFKYLPQIINELQNRNYKFIIFMDDLSFEDFEIEYKYLKAVIEGGLEKKPDNILIYATSNRRHLVKETWNDRNDQEINANDAKQEKLSLVSRFGIQILYTHPEKKQFLTIIDSLAKKNNIKLDQEDLHHQALEWEIRNGGFSGRTAKQFINMLSSKK